MKRKGYVFLTVLVVLSTLITACSTKTETIKETVVVPGTPEVVEKIVTATPAPAAGGGTLTIASNQDIDNYDPHWNQLIAFAVLVSHNIFDTLTKLDANMRVVPSLAESWEISDDGLVYTFYLRPGAKFHNGRPLVADDVVFSFNRLVEQKTTFATKMDPVESIEALDDHTVQITLKSPWAPFLEEIALIAIIAEETVDTLSSEPIGSGPFRFVEWVPNDRIVLEKNPDYDVPGVPKLDQIVIKILPDYAVALTNLEAGSVNAVYNVPAADADRFTGRDDVVFQMPDASNSLALIEMAPMKYEPLQDARVRKALAMCLDKEAIRQNVYFGYGEPQWSSLPKSSWAYIEPAEIPYDPEAAKALLAEAGYPDGFELSIKIIAGHAVMENWTTIWQDGLAKAGVDLEIQIEELSTWLDHYINRDYQTIANGMNVHGDPHSTYDIIFKPHLSDPTSYPNEEMLSLIAEGAVTVDAGRRKALYAQFQQMAVEEMAPVIIIQSQPLIALSTPAVKGWAMNGKGDIFFDGIFIEE